MRAPRFACGAGFAERVRRLFTALLLPAAVAAWVLPSGPASAEVPPAAARQVVLAKAANGGYEWKIIRAPVPAIGPHQVLVHVRAVALNHDDLTRLKPEAHADHSGLIVASDAAGEVIAVGSAVKGIHLGMRVTDTFFTGWTDGPPTAEHLAAMRGTSMNGVLADYIALPDTDVVPFPDTLTYEQAATLPTAGLTAWMAVAGHRSLHAGDIVVVQGTGGVSSFAIQFASATGARVIVTSSSDEKLRLERTQGAQGIFDGSRSDFLRMDAFIAAHALHPVIARVYPLSDYADALRYLATDEFVGKIVLQL